MSNSEKKVKVLFVLIQLESGGSERIVFDLIRSIDRGRYEIFLLSFNGGGLHGSLEQFCEKIFIIEKKSGIDTSAMVKIAKIIKHHKIDVVNAHHYMPFIYCFMGTKIYNRKKLIYTEHSVPEVESVASTFHRRVLNALLFQTDAVVGVSNAITNAFSKRYPNHITKFHKILNGVDIEKFKKRDSRETVRSRFGFSMGHYVVGTVANFRKVKNHLCLLRAVARLKETHSQLRLIFVGTGFPGDPENSEDQVREQICSLGLNERVTMAGYQEDIPDILSAFDAFCLPSISEGLPVSLLEAMSAGVPVIGSDVDGIAEVVTHEKNGLLFPSGDDEKLSFLIKEVMGRPDYAISLGNNGYSYVVNNHAFEAWKKQYENLFLQ